MLTRKKFPSGMIFNVLVKEGEGECIAHCLELDIVATATNVKQVQKDIIDLIGAQISYAFSNNNLDFLYRPAPTEIWQEFYGCKKQIEKRIDIKSKFGDSATGFIPPWFITRTCTASSQACHV